MKTNLVSSFLKGSSMKQLLFKHNYSYFLTIIIHTHIHTYTLTQPQINFWFKIIITLLALRKYFYGTPK